jgi:hypothetical protein
MRRVCQNYERDDVQLFGRHVAFSQVMAAGFDYVICDRRNFISGFPHIFSRIVDGTDGRWGLITKSPFSNPPPLWNFKSFAEKSKKSVAFPNLVV